MSPTGGRLINIQDYLPYRGDRKKIKWWQENNHVKCKEAEFKRQSMALVGKWIQTYFRMNIIQ